MQLSVSLNESEIKKAVKRYLRDAGIEVENVNFTERTEKNENGSITQTFAVCEVKQMDKAPAAVVTNSTPAVA